MYALICRRTPLALSSISCFISSFVVIEGKIALCMIRKSYQIQQPPPSSTVYCCMKITLTEGFHFGFVSSKGYLLENIILARMWKYWSVLLSQEHTVKISSVALSLQGTIGSNVSVAAQTQQRLLRLPWQSLSSTGGVCPCFPWHIVVIDAV